MNIAAKRAKSEGQDERRTGRGADAIGTIGNPMNYTLVTAAKATGKTKATITRDIQEGKISATKLESGSYEIDPSELERVYPLKYLPNGSRIDLLHAENASGTSDTARDVEQLREQLAMMKAERERERAQLLDQIADLRHRLDAEADERRQLTLQLLPKSMNVTIPLPAPAHQVTPSDRMALAKPRLMSLLDRLRTVTS